MIAPSLFTFLKTFFSSFSNPKPLLYLSHLFLLFILLICGDIHPNPYPIDPCSVCSHRVTWGNRSIQCANCSLWVHLSCSGLSPADLWKIFPKHTWTFPMCPSSSQASPSSSQTVSLSSSSNTLKTQNSSSSKTNLPKHLSTITNAWTNIFLILTSTNHPPLALQHFLLQKPSIPSPNSLMMLPLLPFPSATSIVLSNTGCLLKLQTPLRNAEGHSQGHTLMKKTARIILLFQPL